MAKLIALGVDPSLASTGIVVLADGEIMHVECVTTTADAHLGARVREIRCRVHAVVDRLHPRIHVAAVENPGHARNTATATKLGAAFGAALDGCMTGFLDPFEPRVHEHRHVWGRNKTHAVAAIRDRWPELANWPDDAADAASVAWWASERLACALADQPPTPRGTEP